jgi:hypothetical protein
MRSLSFNDRLTLITLLSSSLNFFLQFSEQKQYSLFLYIDLNEVLSSTCILQMGSIGIRDQLIFKAI